MQEYNTARMNYLRAVLNNHQEDEIKNLKILIFTGEKLKKDVTKYKKELRRYNGSISKYTKKSEPIKPIEIKEKKIQKIEIQKNSISEKKTTKPQISKSNTNKSNNYTIKSVVTKDNAIIVEFNTVISKDYIKFFEKTQKSAYQDIYDIKGRFKDAKPTKLSIDGVKQIVIKQENYNTLRILLEDKINLKTIYFINNKKFVIKVLDINKKSKEISKTKVPLSKPSKTIKANKNRVIVLDAGHGGKDSGAVGTNEKYEKTAVFKVTKYLETLLKKRGYRVFLTRDTDKYIKVKNRTVLANKKKADIFLSIHANAAHKTKINELKGIETFFLSPARSERAKRVAALENKSDIRSMSGSTKKVFLESLNRPRITASHKLSIDIQKNMLYSARELYKDVEDGGVREGPFWVLVGAQMPSVLIEIGYITHPIEGKRLYNKKYQQKLALGIANGIDAYFAKNP